MYFKENGYSFQQKLLLILWNHLKIILFQWIELDDQYSSIRSLRIIASLSNFPSAFASFIGTRRLTDEDHLSLQFLKHLSWPRLALPNMFHCETLSVIRLSMKDDQWITNFSHLDIFNSFSVSCIEGDLVSVWGSASATGCLIYQEQGFSPSNRPPFHISVTLPSPLSGTVIASFLSIALYPFRLYSLVIFFISSSVASSFLPPATPCWISAYFLSFSKK